MDTLENVKAKLKEWGVSDSNYKQSGMLDHITNLVHSYSEIIRTKQHFGVYQDSGELESILNLYKKSVEEMETIAANRVGISLEQYKYDIRDELWMTAEQAVTKGHADEVVVVKCAKSLLGTRIQTFQTFFGAVDVEFSNCPIITAPLRVKGKNGLGMDEYNSFIKESFSNIKTTL